MAERLVGRVTRYDSERQAMEVALIAALGRGDAIRVREAASDRPLFDQVVMRLTVEGRDVPAAKARDTARIDVAQAVKRGDRVLRLADASAPPPPEGPQAPEPPAPVPVGPAPPPEPPGPEPHEPRKPREPPDPDDAPDLPDLDDFDDDDGGSGGHDDDKPAPHPRPRHRPKGSGPGG